MDNTKGKELFERYGIDPQPIPRVDDATLEHKARMLPEALRADFIYLGVYFREQCGKNFDLLVDAFKKVGVYHDKTTWTRMLRGQWRRDARGEERSSPVMSEEKFATALEALRTQVRAEAIRGRVPFVQTTTTQDIFQFIDARRDLARVNKWGIIVGPTGSQKTASLKEYQRRNNHSACRWMEAPENGSTSAFIRHLGCRVWA